MNSLTKILLVCTLVLTPIAHAENKKILFISAEHSNKAKVSLIKKIAANEDLSVEQIAENKLGNLNEASITFKQYDPVLFDAVSENKTKEVYEKYREVIGAGLSIFTGIKAPALTDLQNRITPQQAKILFDYYDNGGIKNFTRMVKYLRYKLLNDTAQTIAKPIIYPEVGIYHSDAENLTFNSLEHYQQWRPNDNQHKATIGLMMQRASIESAQTHIIDATIAAMEKRGIHVLPFFYELSPSVSDYSPLIQKDQQSVVDLIINFRSIHWANQRKIEFEKFGVPVMQALTYYDGNQQDWEKSTQGISAGMTPFLLVLPEMAGVIDPIIIAALDHKTSTVQLIDYQLEHMINRAINYTALKYKANADKKLTVMFWGDRDMGASFLNVPESLRSISARLHDEGYTVDKVDESFFTERVDDILTPFYRNYQLDELLKKDLADTLPLEQYQLWFSTLPTPVQESINGFWGEPEQNFMVIERNGKKVFVIPRIRNGNMLVMRQPPRGDNADQDLQLYHKGTVPMNHYYLAAYYYARKHWNSDSIIHLGTHGSQEYLPGKERGLSRYDGGNLAVGDTPVFYPFIVDDVGEAMQSKRRGSAVVISHMTPPYAAAGLQGLSSDIHELMHEYNALDEGGVKVKTAQQIVQSCIDTHLCEDFEWSQEKINADFDGFLEALHNYLGELAAQNQPLGLHSFGELAPIELQTSTVVQMLGSAFTKPASEFETKHYSNQHSHNDDTHSHKHDHQHKPHNDKEHFHESNSELEDLTGFKTVRDFVIHQADNRQLNEELQTLITKGREHHR
ncbi:MAG: cobaltochelatase subunit CobN, partial [Spongiibacteraceae bacterium]|nr:cobaltochelatase subunit CobN [Spongiibacteraceae bacterium]